MTQDNFDPAAFLSECARVHEAGEDAHVRMPVDATDLEARQAFASAVFAARDLRARTYAALLDVARGLVEHRGFVALAAEHPSMSEANRLQARREVTELDAILAPLSRLAAAGGGR